MCGLCGFVEPRVGATGEALDATARRMADTLRHRGPDAEGTYVEPESGLAFGHRRLSILDLSDAGAQPMRSASGRFVLVYNGELYNFRELRGELESEGAAFAGGSDTEVWLAALERWGVRAALERANGMFAFALWDREARRLTLARDRIGKKPLYYGFCDGRFLFGSELKALRAHPGFHAELDRDALAFFLQYSYIPAPHSIFAGIHKLAAGHVLELSLGERGLQAAAPQAWWSLAEVALEGARQPFAGTEDEAVDALEASLDAAVARRCVADVPLGALLSGGLDSAAVVASMSQRGTEPVQTFTIGFEEAAHDESGAAAAVARHLGTQHETLLATPRDVLDVVPSLPALYDEPFADTSQLPTALVSRLARSRVTVALSGDGGDEWLAGYDRYFRCLDRWRILARVPRPLRRALATGLEGVAPLRFDALADTLRATDVRDLFVRANARLPDPTRLVPGAGALPSLFDPEARALPLEDPLAWMMWLDGAGRLPESILVKVDRASMAVGLEVRCPLLDPRFVALCARFPTHWKVRDGARKWLLRRAVERRIPAALLEGPKRGFGVPLAAWLRGPLREWGADLLAASSLEAHGQLAASAVGSLWSEHQTGARDRALLLWNLLVFQAWWQAQDPGATGGPCVA
jgi:asparagine synthase (glutamine-hydrolysing)